MPIYSPGRRRAIIILVLTSVLLLTIDLRGNAMLSAARTAWSEVLRPFESGAEVAARPLRNAWRGITDYNRLENENRDLRDEVDAQRSNDIQARSVVEEHQALKAFLELEQAADYSYQVASVQGASPTNLDQMIEIDKGQADGLRVGMPVVTEQGFVIGRVHRTGQNNARVMLITDERYHLGVRILTPSGELPEPQYNVTTTTTTTTTIPVSISGSLPDDGAAVAVPTSPPTLPPTTPPAAEEADGAPEGDAGEPGDAGAEGATTSTSTTTTTPPLTERETGLINGRGSGSLLEVTLVGDTPVFGAPEVGDYIVTAGGSTGLAPPNLPIGEVVEIERTSPAQGLTLRVQPFADVDNLHAVAIVLYVPPSEAGTLE